MNKDILNAWVLYKKPIDYPEGFIARRFIMDVPTSDTITSKSLDILHEKVEAWFRMYGMTPHLRLPRHKDDDPAILETWI